MGNDPLQPAVIEMLKDLELVLKANGIEYYLVGAVARDIQLSSTNERILLRKTNDVDIAVMIQEEDHFYTVKDALIATGNFQAHPTEAIKIFYKDAIELDLLPFGEIESETREIRLHKPNLFVINMPGFREIFPHTQQTSIDDDLAIKVCSLEGIIILKLIANDDRPQRTKDISDIEQLIKCYFDLNVQNVYEAHFDLMEAFDTNRPDYLELVSARVIGRNMRKILDESDGLTHRISDILKKKEGSLWHEMANGIDD
jgi:predicted nucleotidyltransferase